MTGVESATSARPRRRRALVATFAIIVALGAAAPGVHAASPLEYLLRAQNADGGFGFEPDDDSSAVASGWAGLGLAAAGRNPIEVRRGRRSLISYLRREAAGITAVGEVERTILLLSASGLDPRRVAGRNLVRTLRTMQEADGSFLGFVSYTSFAILALRSTGAPPSSRAIARGLEWLLDHQNEDGGFDLAGAGKQSTVDDSGYALQALAAAGAPRGAINDAVGFLRSAQNPDGGLPFRPGESSNAQSTAYAAQGMVAAGLDPEHVRRGGRSPLGYLRARTAPSGRVSYSATSAQTPIWVTSQALMALSGHPLPLPVVPRSAARSVPERASDVAGARRPARAGSELPAAAGPRPGPARPQGPDGPGGSRTRAGAPQPSSGARPQRRRRLREVARSFAAPLGRLVWLAGQLVWR